MKTFKLIRVVENQYGTFGVLIDKDIPICLTLERKWKNNKKNVSCIPVGLYLCKRIQSSKFGNTFQVLSVPHRSHILFHKGNLNDDTHGCIIIGEQYGHPTLGEGALKSSRKGFEEFLDRLKEENRFLLNIKKG